MPPHDDPPSSTGTPNNQQHPLLEAYERYTQQTAVITRTLLNFTVITYCFSWFLPSIDFSLACYPNFVVGSHGYYEVYRVITSIAVNMNLASVIFACLLFAKTGNTLEKSLGSSAVAWLAGVVFTVGTNVLFIVSCLVLGWISDDSSWTLSSSSGIWTALIGLLALECSLAAKHVPGSTRKLFLWEIPVQFFPVALLVLFSLFSGRFQLAYAISMGLGYAVGYEYGPSWLNGPPGLTQQLEESTLFLNSRLRQQGWVLGPAAMGSAAWESQDESTGESRQTLLSSFAPMFQQRPQQVPGDQPMQGRAGSVFRTGRSVQDTASSVEMSSTAGRTLGGASQRHFDARTARLEALERRQGEV